MIQPLSIQDTSKPLVVSLLNKKAGQSYLFTETANDNNTNNIEFGMPSITFSGKVAPSKDMIISHSKKGEDENENYAFKLPGFEIICLLYIFYCVVMGIGAILFPYYLWDIAIFTCPLLTITILAHTLVNFNRYVAVLGAALVLCYPIVIVMGQVPLVIAFLSLFMVFCLWKALLQKINYIFLSTVFILVVCSAMGVIVYQVYPKSIHGLHASFLCTCILACATVIFAPKHSYKVVCISHAPSINVLAS